MSVDPQATELASIQEEVERLRALAPDTKALYREVAAALFFRFGLAPTANRLHQLVGRGSMSTAAAVLARFWQDLREHSRVRLEHPGIPESLRDTSAELIARIWTSAYELAQQDLDKARLEVKQQLLEARQSAERSVQEAAEAKAKTAEVGAMLDLLRASVAERDGALARALAEAHQLHAENGALQAAVAERRAEVEAAKQSFSADLEALRSAIALTEERARAGERRALGEIEAARLRATDAEKSALQAEKRGRIEIARLEKTLKARDAEVAKLRDRLVRTEAALAHAGGQLKTEQGKFTRLLARVQPTKSNRPRPSSIVKSRKPPKRAAKDTQRKIGINEV